MGSKLAPPRWSEVGTKGTFDKSYDNIIVTGDFNMHFLSQASDKIKNLIASYSAHQLIDTLTHFTETSSSLIDLIFVKNKNHVISSFVADPFIPELTRFHCPVVAVLKFDKPKFKSFKRHIWLYDKGNYNEYRNKLRNVDWNLLTDDNDPDKTIQNNTDKIISVASKTIPNKTIAVRPNDIPSMNTEIRKLIRTRKRLHKEAKRLNNVETWSKFREVQNTVTKHIRKAKLNYQNKLVEIINSSSTSPKTWFKVAKRLTQKQTKCTIPTLYDNNMEASTDISKAELLNSYFSRQSTLDDHDQQLPHNITVIESTLSHLTITPCDVKDAISLIDSSKASGPDFVSPKLLCEGSTELCTVLSHLFNSLLALSYFPSAWKLANVTPIFKKGDPSKPSNYQPISLLSCLGKLFERCVHKYLYNYLNDNRLLTKYQSGFIKGDSTTNQLIFIYDDINRALDEGLEVRAVFCDISKAFDRVWHRGLLHKLSSLGICGPLLKWFSSYLTLRKQRVVCSNVSSDWSIINAGVPQGSILGPLLFLIYINDIVSQINTNVRLFADDTSLYVHCNCGNTRSGSDSS